MTRNKLAEIAAVRGRGQSDTWRGKYAVTELHQRVEDGLTYPASFVIIRLVTAIEVFTRDWVKSLVDSGDPYVGRAADLLKGTLKIDFAVARSLVGKQVTFGDLVAHEIAVNGVGDLDRVFSHLLEDPAFERAATAVDRWRVEVLKEPVMPFMPDPRQTKACLDRLFTTRHIHVHELPDEAHIEPETLAEYVAAAVAYCEAFDEMLSTELYGAYPLTQLEMNARAGDKANEAADQLKDVLLRLDPDGANANLKASQVAWEAYRDRQAEFRSNINSPTRGSIAPLIHASELEKITRARIEELDWYLTRKDGEM